MTVHKKFNDTLPRFPSAEDFAFSEPKIDVGWFDIRLQCSGRQYDFTTSYLSEPFSGFLGVLLELHRYYEGHIWGCDDEMNALTMEDAWQGEPWRYDWTFWPRTGREINMRLDYHSDYVGRAPDPSNKTMMWFEVCVPLEVLLRQWHDIGKTILREHGLIGYRRSWMNSEFPLKDFHGLHEIVTSEKSQVTNLEDDIRFLARLTKP